MLALFEVHWKVKVGYGDILSPLCYTYNENVRRDEETSLVYLSSNHKEHKYKVNDPETLFERIRFLEKHTDISDLKHDALVDIEYGVNLPDSFDHENYQDLNTSLHNLRFSKTYRWSFEQSDNHIALITTLKNKQTFRGDAAWKDPYQGRWNEAIPSFPKAEFIHYETPIDEACEIISTAKYVITYHGSAAWLCKWIGVPMIVVSGKPVWSETVFPWSFATPSLDINLERAVKSSEERIKQVNLKLSEYLYGPKKPLSSHPSRIGLNC